MKSTISDLINTACHRTRSWTELRHSIGVIVLALSLYLTFCAWVLGTSRFSPDSWMYLALSKSIFSRNFYFVSSDYANNFPFGYPILLALAHFLLGENPLVAVAVNIGLALATVYVAVKICKILQIPRMMHLAISLALICYPGYWDEIFSGRSIPLAILVFCAASYFVLVDKPIVSGFFLGFSALTRFDFLVYAIFFHVAVLLLSRKPRREIGYIVSGFLLSTLPWILYCHSHFGTIWATNNSWVALSALPASAGDYPAHAAVTAQENPRMWLGRWLGNAPSLVKQIARSALGYPLIPLFTAYLAYNWGAVDSNTRRRLLIAFLLLAAATAPYLLTGYFESRYFSIIFLVFGFVLLNAAMQTNGAANHSVEVACVTLAALASTTLLGVLLIAREVSSHFANARSSTSQMHQVEHLLRCHRASPQTTLIFGNATRDVTFGYQYLALTGMRVAVIPSNFDVMSDRERSAYFQHVSPYVLASRWPDGAACGNFPLNISTSTPVKQAR